MALRIGRKNREGIIITELATGRKIEVFLVKNKQGPGLVVEASRDFKIDRAESVPKNERSQMQNDLADQRELDKCNKLLGKSK